MLETLRERALELLDVGRACAGAARRPLPRARRAIRAGAQGARPGGLGRAGGARARQPARRARATPSRCAALRIAAALGFFWYTHGYSAEGISHLERTLAAAGDAPPLLRGRALQALGILRSQRGDERAEATFREALAMFRAAGDQARVAVALNSLGVMARDRGDTAGARAAFEEAIDTYRSLDDRHRLADALSNLAFVAIDQDRLDEAAALFGESIALDRAFDNQWGVAQNLSGQATARARPRRARRGGRTARRGGPGAAPARRSAVAGQPRSSGWPPPRRCANDHAFAARLWGAATAQRDAAGEPRTVAEAAAIDRHLDASRAALGARALRGGRERGRRARPRGRARRSADVLTPQGATGRRPAA